MITTNRNIVGQLVTASQLARALAKRLAFQQGYASAIRNEPYNYTLDNKTEAVDYARGRAFAIWSQVRGWKGCRWKDGKLSKAAQDRLVMALHERAIL